MEFPAQFLDARNRNGHVPFYLTGHLPEVQLGDNKPSNILKQGKRFYGERPYRSEPRKPILVEG